MTDKCTSKLELEKKLQKYGYGQSVSAIMIPLVILRGFSDSEILALKDFDIQLIVSPKIKRYLLNRYLSLGVKRDEIRSMFPDKFE